MKARAVTGTPRRRRAAAAGNVVSLERARIERALPRRQRYRYVQPRVEPLGAGWKVVSPNCSRSVDPAGGEIDIAWLQPLAQGLWQLHARDHAAGQWIVNAPPLTLERAIERLLADPLGEYWR